MKISIKSALLITTCGLMLATPALAQTTPQDDVSSANDEGEIIVTATLREANVQNIPIAVTAVSPTTLERQGVTDIKLLPSISPSISFQSSNTETQGTTIRIRGVGTTGNNTGLESSVGVFIDGVYQSRPGVALGDLIDLERLEVLRGPQGTLFGRNTSAGALNVTTKKPSLSKFEGFASATYGNYNLMNVQASVGGPITENVGARISGAWRKRDGFLKSSTGATSHDRDRWLLRGQLYFEPSADLSIRLIADYSKVDEKCCDAVIVRETELAPFAAFHGLTSTGVVNAGFPALNNLQSNGEQSINVSKQWGFSGELKYDFGGAKLTYIGSYRDFDSFWRNEADFTSLNIFTVGNGGTANTPGLPNQGDRIKTMTHELRVQGTAFDDKLDWLIGGFYGDEDIVHHQTATVGTDFQRAVSAFNFGPAAGVNPLFAFTAAGNAGVPVNAAGAFASNRFFQNGKTLSIFTHNVFNLTDKLSVTLGARYVDERKDAGFRQLQSSNAACQASVNGALTGAIPGVFVPPVVGLNCFAVAAPVSVTAPAALGGGLASRFLPLPREWANVFKDNELTYTAQMAYKPNEDMLIYGSFSHGFKSGGFNLQPTSATLANSAAVLTTGAAPVFGDPRFDSEKVDSYELGAKATFGRIKANVALFHMDMTDFQVLEFTGIQFETFNVGKAKSTGIEVELFGKLDDNISANVSATYADARYPRDCAAGVTGGALATVTALCGASLTNAPKFTGIFGMTYDGPLGSSGWGLLANFNVNYSSKRRTSTVPTDTNGLPIPLDFQEDYFKVNARLGFTTPDQRFTFEIWGTNLSNEITRSLTSVTPLRGIAGARSRLGFVEEPRTYGVTVRTKF
jgi:iron complex outermembrane receptor protein